MICAEIRRSFAMCVSQDICVSSRMQTRTHARSHSRTQIAHTAHVLSLLHLHFSSSPPTLRCILPFPASLVICPLPPSCLSLCVTPIPMLTVITHRLRQDRHHGLPGSSNARFREAGTHNSARRFVRACARGSNVCNCCGLLREK